MSSKSASGHDLSACIEYFNENRTEFVTNHHRMFVAICNRQVLGFYEDVQSAYMAAKARCDQNPFLVRQCLTVDEETASAPVFHSRVG